MHNYLPTFYAYYLSVKCIHNTVYRTLLIWTLKLWAPQLAGQPEDEVHTDIMHAH